MKNIKKLFRKTEVLCGKQRFYESVTPQGYRYIFDYVDNTVSYPLLGIAVRLGFSSLEEAFKSDVFQQGIKELGCDINKLAYTVDYE